MISDKNRKKRLKKLKMMLEKMRSTPVDLTKSIDPPKKKTSSKAQELLNRIRQLTVEPGKNDDL